MKILLTDCTLAELDAYDAEPGRLFQLLRELEKLPVAALELSSAVYRKLRPFAIFSGAKKAYFLRIRYEEEQSLYPGFAGYLMLDREPREAGEAERFCCIDEKNALMFYRLRGYCKCTGIVGRSVLSVLAAQKDSFELAPLDQYHCATALAMEWMMQGGCRVAGALAGMGGCACLEEILAALHARKMADFSGSLLALPRAKHYLEQITGKCIPKKKPVLGQDIFAVEAGIHVDGLQKSSELYEPYPPTLVGLERRIVMGKYSGRRAVSIKAQEMGIELRPGQAEKILVCLQEYCTVTRHSPGDEEFCELIRAEG